MGENKTEKLLLAQSLAHLLIDLFIHFINLIRKYLFVCLFLPFFLSFFLFRILLL